MSDTDDLAAEALAEGIRYAARLLLRRGKIRQGEAAHLMSLAARARRGERLPEIEEER